MKKLVASLLLLVTTIGHTIMADCSFPTYGSLAGRYLTSFTLSGGGTTGEVAVNQLQTVGASIYFDRTSTIVTFASGTELSFSSLAWSGEWMHGYLYIDYNNDGEFNTVVNTDGTGTGELVSYSYLDGTNSKGQYAANNSGVKASAMPSFILPALEEGDYKVRFKVDWNSIDPCGASSIGSDRGCVVDFTLRIGEVEPTPPPGPATDYPEMTRTFTNSASQQNRYLRRVTTTGTQTPVVFECNTQEELPYTQFSASAGTYVTEGALIDKTKTPIVVDQGVTSFNVTMFGWSASLGAYSNYAHELEWTQEACFVDWNQDFQFSGSDEVSEKSGNDQTNPALFAADGYTRTVTIPRNQPAGTYRMRVVFNEPQTLTDQWQNTIFNNCKIRNGVAYDFEIQILDPIDMVVEDVTVTKNTGAVNLGEEDLILASVLVDVAGSLNPVAFTQLKASYTGTDVEDVNDLRVVYSTTGRVTHNVLGTKSVSSDEIIFDASQELGPGKNYFLLVGRVAQTATLGNSISVVVPSVTIGGVVYPLETTGTGGYAIQNVVDFTKGNAIWFETPTSSTQGAAIWNTNDFSTSSTNPDQIWEQQSLPIGNGSFGGNILGSVKRERIVLNEKTLWKGGPGTGASAYWDMNNTVSESTLSTIRNYLLQGNNSYANSLVSSNYKGKINYDRYKFGTYTVMGEAYINTGIDENAVQNYKRILNIDSSMVVVQFQANGVDYQRRYFCSYPDNVMVWQFASEGGTQDLTFSFNCPQVVNSVTAQGNGLLYDCKLDNNNMAWAMRVFARTNGGGTISVNASAGTITVSGSTNVEFIVAADTDYKMNFTPSYTDNNAFVGVNPINSVNEWVDAAKAKSYAGLYNTHREDYSKLFNRVDLSINPDKEFENLPTPTRLTNYRNGTLDHDLEKIYFQYGRYLLIACSRSGTMPANLQGMWHNNTDGPWRVDYHNNINLQMNYWPATCTNLLECFEPFIDYVKGLVEPGKRTAQAYYGARGWTAEVSTNIFGFTAPLNSTEMSWNYNPTAGPWLVTQIWEYYDYTRDKEWLRDTGYEIIKQSANFVSDLLFLANGTYTSAPSYSPEHGTCDLGATYANAVTREVLIEAIKAAEILDTDADLVAEWKEKLNRMYPYQIGQYGQLQEWYKDIDPYMDDHRHTNHLFGLHPGSTISPISTPDLAAACKETLRQRGDAATGWSMGWKLNHWARLHDGDHAYVLFQNLLKNGTANNLWDMHPPFQIDGNFGGTAGVSELFLQSQADSLYLLPALPSKWTEGYITGLLARGNFEVDIYYSDNKLDYAVILSNKGEECRVRYDGKVLVFPTEAGQTYKVTYNRVTDQLTYDDLSRVESLELNLDEVVKIIPNPNNGDFWVSVQGAHKGNLNLTIYSLAGDKLNEVAVEKENISSIEVPFSYDLASGCYLLSVQGNGFATSRKFLVQ